MSLTRLFSQINTSRPFIVSFPHTKITIPNDNPQRISVAYLGKTSIILTPFEKHRYNDIQTRTNPANENCFSRPRHFHSSPFFQPHSVRISFRTRIPKTKTAVEAFPIRGSLNIYAFEVATCYNLPLRKRCSFVHLVVQRAFAAEIRHGICLPRGFRLSPSRFVLFSVRNPSLRF